MSNPTINLRDNRNPGKDWFFVDAEFLSVYAARVGPFGIAAYIFMVGKVFRDPELRFSLNDIAESTGISKASALRGVRRLVDEGLVVVTSAGTNRKAASYSLSDVKTLVRESPAVPIEPLSGSYRTAANSAVPIEPLAVPIEPLAVPIEPPMIKENKIETKTPRHASRSSGGSTAPPEQPPPRRDAVRDAVQAAQQATLGAVVWPPGADRALLAMLRDYPEADWPTERLLACVANRFASAQDPAQPPQRWIRDLPRYISGPKDRFELVDAGKSPPAARCRTKPPDFAAAAPLVSANLPPASQLAESVRSRIKHRLRGLADPATRDAWLGPLVFSYVGRNNRVIVLAPSTEWKGFQEKFGEKINTILGDCGLTGGHEMWYFTPKGEWIRPT